MRGLSPREFLSGPRRYLRSIHKADHGTHLTTPIMSFNPTTAKAISPRRRRGRRGNPKRWQASPNRGRAKTQEVTSLRGWLKLKSESVSETFQFVFGLRAPVRNGSVPKNSQTNFKPVRWGAQRCFLRVFPVGNDVKRLLLRSHLFSKDISCSWKAKKHREERSTNM